MCFVGIPPYRLSAESDINFIIFLNSEALVSVTHF